MKNIWECIKAAAESEHTSITRLKGTCGEDLDFIDKWIDEHLKETQ